MRLASFNLENLFDRAKILNPSTWEAQGRAALQAFERVNDLLEKSTYTPADKTKILEGLDTLGVKSSDDGGTFALLRQNHGKLLKRPNGGPVEVVASGRGDWIGWLELKTEKVDEIALRNTAQVVRDVNADVLGVIEADNRIAVSRFNDQLLPAVGGARYAHVMLIDGNDERGIDVAILTRTGFDLVAIRSHVDDVDGDGRIFSRDCVEYTVGLPSGERLLVLANHLKSKGFGTPATSNARRKRQATEVRRIYDARRAEGWKFVAVTGDLNDTPGSDPLSPLLGAGSDLKDVSEHPSYVSDGRPGTYANGTASNKIDYILMSPELFSKTTAGGVFRKGVWGGVNGTLFPHYPEMTAAIHAASDHAAIWADVAI
jgi:endonuclease/exonuclease/phosphatase family metal-dependent hydrolase